jgi:hypothetical protein
VVAKARRATGPAQKAVPERLGYRENLSFNSSQAPSNPGNSDPAVIPHNAQLAHNACALTQRQVDNPQICFPPFSMDRMYVSISSMFVTLETDCCGIKRSLSIAINSRIEK